MPYDTLHSLNTESQAVFDHLTQDLAVGSLRKIDNASARLMAVSVARISERHYSIAHFFQQNGDLMSDPEMTFFKSADGVVYPCTFQQDHPRLYRVGLLITDAGVIEAHNAPVQVDQTKFAKIWMRTIADQQELPFPFPPEDTDD